MKTVLLLILATTVFTLPLDAQAILWQSPDLIPPPSQEQIRDIEDIPALLPSTAVKAEIEQPVNIFFTGKQYALFFMLESSGWITCPFTFKERAAKALSNLSQESLTCVFNNPVKYVFNNRTNDAAFIRQLSEKRYAELRLWRLAYKTKKGLPVWAASIKDFRTKTCKDISKCGDTKGLKSELSDNASVIVREKPGSVKSKDPVLIIELKDN